LGKPDGKRRGDIGIRIFNMWEGGGAWTGFIWLRIGTVGWSL
jgi:hypothetical protein